MSEKRDINEITVFRALWNRLPKRSFVSGLFLRDFEASPFFLNCFAHVLSKKQYPYFRLYARNIVLLTPEEHLLYDQGTESQRQEYKKRLFEKTGKDIVQWDKLYALQEELKKMYKEEFPKTFGLIIGYKYDEEEVIKKIAILNFLFWQSFNGSDDKGGDVRKVSPP